MNICVASTFLFKESTKYLNQCDCMTTHKQVKGTFLNMDCDNFFILLPYFVSSWYGTFNSAPVYFSCVWPSMTLWTAALQAPLSMEFSRQEHWSGLPCPTPGDLPNPGIERMSLMSPTLAGGFFTTEWDLVHYMDFEANHDYQMH